MPNCTCLANGFQCTNMCNLQDCDNRREDPTEAIVDTDDDDNDKTSQEETRYQHDLRKAETIS